MCWACKIVQSLGCDHTTTKSAVHATMQPNYWATVITWPKCEETWLSMGLAMYVKKRGGFTIMVVKSRRLSTSCSCAEETSPCPSVTSSPLSLWSCYLGGPALVSSMSADLVYPSDSCYPERLLGTKCSRQVEGRCAKVRQAGTLISAWWGNTSTENKETFRDRRLSTSVLRPNVITRVVVTTSTSCECTLIWRLMPAESSANHSTCSSNVCIYASISRMHSVKNGLQYLWARLQGI